MNDLPVLNVLNVLMKSNEMRKSDERILSETDGKEAPAQRGRCHPRTTHHGPSRRPVARIDEPTDERRFAGAQPSPSNPLRRRSMPRSPSRLAIADEENRSAVRAALDRVQRRVVLSLLRSRLSSIQHRSRVDSAPRTQAQARGSHQGRSRCRSVDLDSPPMPHHQSEPRTASRQADTITWLTGRGLRESIPDACFSIASCGGPSRSPSREN